MALRFDSKYIISLLIATALTGCTNSFGMDVRDQFGGILDTSSAAANAVADRPEPDARGVLTFPSYQVILARAGDRIEDVAARIGVDADRLGQFNGIPREAILRHGEVIVLPSNMTAVAADGAPLTPTIVDIREFSDAPSAEPHAAEPKRHKVVEGETIYTISRLYSVSAEDLAKWNSLNLTTELRPGQYLLIPITPIPPVEVSAPGAGSIAPAPPSSTRPQPRSAQPQTAAIPAQAAAPAPVADTGPITQASQSDARFMRPVSGTIIRSYKKGVNEGIDIGAPGGTAVSAADVGTVAAITKDTKGVAIVVIKHADGLLTVYTNIDSLSVKKGDAVTRGQEIAKIREGAPSFLHFEVRKGLESVNPDDYI